MYLWGTNRGWLISKKLNKDAFHIHSLHFGGIDQHRLVYSCWFISDIEWSVFCELKEQFMLFSVGKYRMLARFLKFPFKIKLFLLFFLGMSILDEVTNSVEAVFVRDEVWTGWHGDFGPDVQSHRSFVPLHQRSVKNELYLIFKDTHVTCHGFTFHGVEATPMTVCLWARWRDSRRQSTANTATAQHCPTFNTNISAVSSSCYW